MCGRFTLSKPVRTVAELFSLSEPPPELKPRYNVAPSQVVAVIGRKPDGQSRGLALLRWGLVPEWANDPKSAFINARAETVHQLPTFRDAFRNRRCLIPADGFFEWMDTGKGKKKRPHHIRLKGDGLFAFAGLWSVWGEGKEKLRTCCLITTEANELVRPVHDRMPAILRPDDYDPWLDPGTPVDQLRGLLRPYAADEMELVEVGPAVGSPRNDGPECVAPAA